MVSLVFLVLTHLPPITTLFIATNVVLVQAVLNAKEGCQKVILREGVNCENCAKACTLVLAILLLLFPTPAAVKYIIDKEDTRERIMVPITLILSLLVLSIVWSSKYQNHIMMVVKGEQNPKENNSPAKKNQSCML